MRTDRAGFLRLITELVDYAESHDGQFPATRTLTDYSPSEIKDVQLSLPRAHWGNRGSTIVVKIREHYTSTYGSSDSFRAAACRAIGREIVNRGDLQRAERKQLLELLQSVDLPQDAGARLQERIEIDRSWLNRSFRGDGLDITKERLRSFASLLAALPVAAEEPIRQYCARVVKDSHSLDEDDSLRAAFEAELRARNPDEESLDDAYLAEGLLPRLNHGVILVSGQLALRIDGAVLDGSSLAIVGAPLAIAEAALHRAALTQPYPTAAVFVENPASWESLSHRVGPDILCILTDGMPTRAVRRLVQLLAEQNIPTFHWGDIDVGGIRILRVLQKQGPVNPILMDAATIHRYASHLTGFRGRKRAHMEQHRQEAAIAACLAAGGWLEQEAVPVDDAVAELRRAIAAQISHHDVPMGALRTPGQTGGSYP